MVGKPWTGRETQRAYDESLAERRALREAVDALRRDIWVDRILIASVAAGAFGKSALALMGIVIP